MKPLVIATRGSALALWQAHYVRDHLEQHGHSVELNIIQTQGDQQQGAFASMQGQGFFTKAVQQALLDGTADIAVHSYKDLPSDTPPQLTIAAVPPREAPHDVLIVKKSCFDSKQPDIPLPQGAVVGTSSIRRKAQLLFTRPDLQIKELRGNVPTRLERLNTPEYDAIVLAAAGLARLELDLSQWVAYRFALPNLVPAPSQGALAIEVHRSNTRALEAVSTLEHAPSRQLVQAERALMAKLDGGCQLALGAVAVEFNGGIRLLAWYRNHLFMADHANPQQVAQSVFEQIQNTVGA